MMPMKMNSGIRLPKQLISEETTIRVVEVTAVEVQENQVSPQLEVSHPDIEETFSNYTSYMKS